MKAFTKWDIIRCMQNALVRLDGRKEQEFREGYQYYYLMEATVQILAEEEPSLKPANGNYQDTVNYLTGRGPLAVPLMEGYWYLVSNGYIVQSVSGGKPDFNKIRLTGMGREWAFNGDTLPEDQHGYLAALRAEVPTLDSVIEQYTEEAVAAFARQMYFAAAVMIGAASEKLVYLLMDSLRTAVSSPTEKAAIKNTINERSLPAMFTKLQHHFTVGRKKKSIPWTISEGAELHLLSLQDAIRVQRNEAVHPLAGKVTPQTVRLSLASFPAACKKTYDVMGWFQTNKI